MEPTKPATSRAATPVARSSASTPLLAPGGAAIGCGRVAQVTLACARRSLRAQRRRRGRLGHACRPGARLGAFPGRKRRRRAPKLPEFTEFDAPSTARIALRDSTRRLRACARRLPRRVARREALLVPRASAARWRTSRTTSACPAAAGGGCVAAACARARRAPGGDLAACTGRLALRSAADGSPRRVRVRWAAPRRATRGTAAALSAAPPGRA